MEKQKNITILVVEDSFYERDAAVSLLREHGYAVLESPDGETALKILSHKQVHLVLLDLNLPDTDGLKIAKEIRRNTMTQHMSVIIFSERSSVYDIELGLKTAGDDYITKPYHPRILLARIEALLRRSGMLLPEIKELTFKTITLNFSEHYVKVSGVMIDLTVTEFTLLSFLLKNPYRVWSKGQLISVLHGDDYAIIDRVMNNYIASLRKKLGEAGNYIKTVTGVGYKLSNDDR